MSEFVTSHVDLAVRAHRMSYVCVKLAAVALCNVLLMGALHAAEPLPDVLTSVRQVHDLPALEAARHIPVHLLATVSLYEPKSKKFFVQDASGGVFVYTSKPYPIADGDLIEINGVTEKSFRTVVRMNPEIRVVHHGNLPDPVLLSKNSYTELMGGRWDCLRVTLPGKVRSAIINSKEFGRLDMEVLIDGGVVNVTIDHPLAVDVTSLIDSDVLITGLAGATFDAKWQEMSPLLIGASLKDILILKRPRQNFADVPETRVEDIMQTQSVMDTSRRVRVRGVVMAYRPGDSVVIRQDDRSLTAATQQRIDVPLGSVVDLSGFATLGDYGPAMKQVTILPTGRMQDVMPYSATYTEAISGKYSDDFVSIRGKVLSQISTDSLDQVTILMDQHAVPVSLEHLSNGKRLPSFPVGTEIEAHGICRVTITDGWGNPGATPMIFRVDMRSAEDILVLRAASWWTVEHLLKSMFALCLASLVVSLWAVALRKRVSSQTSEIKRSMSLERERSRLLESINTMTPIKEWIADLRNTCEVLLPGICCLCSAYDALDPEDIAFLDRSSMHSVFERKLHDGRGTTLGRLQGYREDGRKLSTYEYEVLEVFAGLATIAVNQIRMYDELNYTSTHDQLTSLPNRRMADACLERALLQGGRTESIVLVAYIDVNHFKQVNDQHGHKIGDLYLQQIASRLKQSVRGTDLVARIGGDEFLLIAGGLSTVPQAELYRDRLNSCFDEPFDVDGHIFSGSASVGLAIAPDHGNRPEELKRQADLDMYNVKNKHHGAAVPVPAGLYSPSDLEAALADERFVLFYQPLFCPEGILCGVEALIRLHDPATGIVPPSAFIDVAEESSVILPLGKWVLKQAVADAKRWDLHGANARIMVNVSIRQVEHPDFASDVLQILKSAGLPSHCLELEITERLMMENPPQVMRQLKQLRSSGVQIAIDDFGVQHSSLSALRSLPFDTLKLDRTFINAIEEDQSALHIVGAIVSMARALGKRIVAEGVETEQQVHALAKFPGVDLQGYYFSRPRPAHEITASLETWIAGPRASTTVATTLLPQLAFAS